MRLLQPGLQCAAVLLPPCSGEGIWQGGRRGTREMTPLYSGGVVAPGGGIRLCPAGAAARLGRAALVRMRTAHLGVPIAECPLWKGAAPQADIPCSRSHRRCRRSSSGGWRTGRPPTANSPYRPSCFALQGQLNYCIVAGSIVDKHRSSGPQAAPLYLTDHRVVFRARSAEAEFTISDWASNERGGPVRRRPMHSYIEIQP